MTDKTMTLGVKMCGNCNPSIESMRVVNEIAHALGVAIIPYPQGTVTLKLSACSVACVENVYPSLVTIRGLELNGCRCRDEADLIEKAIEILRPYFGQESKNGI